MQNLVVVAKTKKHLLELIEKDIDAVLIYIDKLSVNNSFSMSINEVNEIDFKGKEVFLCINKIMHSSSLPLVREFLEQVKDKNYKILFYDMGVYNIAKDIHIEDKLVIYQDHLNANTYSNNFYYDLGIKGSYINSDITHEELNKMKENSNGFIMITSYGYVPIFMSRRYLLTNYMKYIGLSKKEAQYHLISDEDKYPICEESDGTAIYTKEPINLINRLDDIKNIDYLVLNSNLITLEEYNKVVDNYISKVPMNNCYLGFFDTKTIYKVKGE